MKRRIYFVLMIILCIFAFTACGLFSPQKYVCDENEVKSIQIIKLDKYIDDELRFEYTVLADIVDQSTFIKRLNDLKHSVNWGDPMVLKEGYIVIKIDYLNGDYEWLHHNALLYQRNGVKNHGYFFFDKDEFDLLISDYVKE